VRVIALVTLQAGLDAPSSPSFHRKAVQNGAQRHQVIGEVTCVKPSEDVTRNGLQLSVYLVHFGPRLMLGTRVAIEPHDPRPLMGGLLLQAQLGQERDQSMMVAVDPFAAGLVPTITQRNSERASANPVSSLENGYIVAFLLQQQGSPEAGKPCADDRDLHESV
jgi:hypothetical protein